MQNTFLTFRANQQITVSFKNNIYLYRITLKSIQKYNHLLMNYILKYLGLERALKTSFGNPNMKILGSFIGCLNEFALILLTTKTA